MYIMSENLKIKVKLVVGVCLLLTSGIVVGHWFISRNTRNVANGITKSAIPELCFYAFGIGSELLAMVGAIKREKWLLVPFLLFLCLVVMGCLGCYLNVITGGNEAITLVLGMLKSDNEHGKDTIIALLVISSIFCLAAFSLLTIIQLYKEIILDDICDEEEEKLIEPLSGSSTSPFPSDTKMYNKNNYFVFKG